MSNLRAQEAEKAAAMFQNRKFLDQRDADEHFFETNEFGGTTNKEVANILEAKGGADTQQQKPQAAVIVDEGGWADDDDDIDIEP